MATAIADETNAESGISIHALVKRATMLDKTVNQKFCISIHALVKRATPVYMCSNSVSLLFQSTPS